MFHRIVLSIVEPVGTPSAVAAHINQVKVLLLVRVSHPETLVGKVRLDSFAQRLLLLVKVVTNRFLVPRAVHTQ